MKLSASDRAPGLLLGDDVSIPEDAAIGGHVVIHAGTRLGAGVTIQDGAVVGKPLHLGPKSTAPSHSGGPTIVSDSAAILAGAVIFAGAELGEGSIAGDQSQIRERALVGPGAVIGRGSAVDNDVRIGPGVRVQSNCYITAYSVLEDDVFVGPGVVLTNDNTMGRADAGELTGAILRRGCRIGGGVTVCPGVEIGAEAYIAAGAVVTTDVGPRQVAMGVPARVVRDVPDSDRIDTAQET